MPAAGGRLVLSGHDAYGAGAGVAVPREAGATVQTRPLGQLGKWRLEGAGLGRGSFVGTHVFAWAAVGEVDADGTALAVGTADADGAWVATGAVLAIGAAVAVSVSVALGTVTTGADVSVGVVETVPPPEHETSGTGESKPRAAR
jgi:hypothetical protein